MKQPAPWRLNWVYSLRTLRTCPTACPVFRRSSARSPRDVRSKAGRHRSRHGGGGASRLPRLICGGLPLFRRYPPGLRFLLGHLVARTAVRADGQAHRPGPRPDLTAQLQTGRPTAQRGLRPSRRMLPSGRCLLYPPKSCWPVWLITVGRLAPRCPTTRLTNDCGTIERFPAYGPQRIRMTSRPCGSDPNRTTR